MLIIHLSLFLFIVYLCIVNAHSLIFKFDSAALYLDKASVFFSTDAKWLLCFKFYFTLSFLLRELYWLIETKLKKNSKITWFKWIIAFNFAFFFKNDCSHSICYIYFKINWCCALFSLDCSQNNIIKLFIKSFFNWF